MAALGVTVQFEYDVRFNLATVVREPAIKDLYKREPINARIQITRKC